MHKKSKSTKTCLSAWALECTVYNKIVWLVFDLFDHSGHDTWFGKKLTHFTTFFKDQDKCNSYCDTMTNCKLYGTMPSPVSRITHCHPSQSIGTQQVTIVFNIHFLPHCSQYGRSAPKKQVYLKTHMPQWTFSILQWVLTNWHLPAIWYHSEWKGGNYKLSYRKGKHYSPGQHFSYVP